MNRIKELRLEKGLTQKEIAGLLGCNQTALGKYERGDLEPSINTLKKLSAIFNCSVDYIVCNADDFGVIANNGSSVLTVNESEMLKNFRLLNEKEQREAIGFVKALAY